MAKMRAKGRGAGDRTASPADYPGLVGFGEDGAAMAEAFDGKRERRRWCPGDARIVSHNAMISIGELAAVLRGIEAAAVQTGNTSCADHASRGLQLAHQTWFDAAHTDRLVQSGLRTVMETQLGGTFEIILHGELPTGMSVEALLMQEIRAARARRAKQREEA